MNIKFSTCEYNCRLEWLNYTSNGNVALVARDAADGSPIGALSINTYEELPSDVIAIKDYSENEGVLKSLVDNGVLAEPEDWINIGYVQIPVCRILKRKTI